MGVVDTLLFRTSRGRARQEALRLGEWVRDDPDAGLVHFARFVAALDEAVPQPDHRLLVLDVLAATLREAGADLVAVLRAQPLPLHPEALTRLHRFLRGVRLVRDALRRVYGLILQPHESTGAADRSALTVLAHALSMQSLLLKTACQVRVGLARDEWDELCRLAWPLWRVNQLDLAPRGGADPEHAHTPRVDLLEPVLLRLLEPLSLAPLEWDFASDEARRAARRVGVNMENDGGVRQTADGPALMLSSEYSLQLDTRSVIHDIRMRLAMVQQGASLAEASIRASLARAHARSVMDRLANVWGCGYTPVPWQRPPVPRVLVCWGLPGERWPLAARRAPVVAGVQEAGMDPAWQDLAERAEILSWRGLDGRRAVFGRSVPAPRLSLGQLVVMLPWQIHEAQRQPPPERSGLPGVMMGRIASLTQMGSPNSRQPFAHEIGVVFWPGVPVRVQWLSPGSRELEQGWYVPETALAPASVLVPRETFVEPFVVPCLAGSGVAQLNVVRLLERGPDFDRVECASLA